MYLNIITGTPPYYSFQKGEEGCFERDGWRERRQLGGWRHQTGKVHFIMYFPGREVRGAEWKISVPYCPKGDLMGGGTGQGWLIS